MNEVNKKLRRRIVEMISRSGEGHIPSSFSIVDIINCLYSDFLKVNPKDPNWSDRDYFVLSKGHGAAALFVVLEEKGFLSDADIQSYGKFDSILGGHPDRTKVPGAEASTGSLGHGLSFAIGLALGQKIQKRPGKVVVLVGDGECHEGTVWEAALAAQNLGLTNLCCIVDYNHSSTQILPHPDLMGQWESFGWVTRSVDGHSDNDIKSAIKDFFTGETTKPLAIVANTTKGKGVSFLEGHGIWHHKIPNKTEFETIMSELSI
jgi:transketolase